MLVAAHWLSCAALLARPDDPALTAWVLLVVYIVGRLDELPAGVPLQQREAGARLLVEVDGAAGRVGVARGGARHLRAVDVRLGAAVDLVARNSDHHRRCTCTNSAGICLFDVRA